jgi:hypothetical protein
MDKRDKHQQEQTGGEKPNTLIHDQIDHERAAFDTQRSRKRCRSTSRSNGPAGEATCGH